IRMGELAQSVIFSPSRLTHTYRRLADRDLIVRTAYEFDRRGGTITITDAGKKLVTSAQQAERALLRDIISDDISDEDLNVLIRVGSDVNTRLDEVEKR
ncbi:MAG: MarR family transcriptional regulator, partial [Trueperella pyogenes]|nr:MarR family transcriptional regulator [Trueperella pyogenes]